VTYKKMLAELRALKGLADTRLKFVTTVAEKHWCEGRISAFEEVIALASAPGKILKAGPVRSVCVCPPLGPPGAEGVPGEPASKHGRHYSQTDA